MNPKDLSTTIARAPVPAGMSPAEWSMRCELAALYRLVDHYGYADLLSSHISARVPDQPDLFLVNPYGLLFEEVTASNLVKVDENGKIVGESNYGFNPAGFVIHSCVHQARPEVACVIHLHSRDSVGVATQACGLLPVTQHALVIWDQIVYHDFEGPVFNTEEQQRIISDMGDKNIMIMRNHGTLVAGRTIAEAYVRMYRIERACRMQIAAQAGGELNALSQKVIDDSVETGRRIFSKGGFSPDGELEWAAMLRKLDRMGVPYAS